MLSLQSGFGLLALTGLAWLCSENRAAVRGREILLGLGLQLLLAVLFLKLPFCKQLFLGLNRMILVLQQATESGMSFVFGYLGGGPPPFTETAPLNSFIFAFRGLPLILVVSALSSLLFYWRIMPLVVRGFSWLLRKSFGIGGALGVGAGASIFVGMVEAPMFIRPYLNQLTRSELFTIMTCGMATIAGTVMVAMPVSCKGLCRTPWAISSPPRSSAPRPPSPWRA